MKDEEPERAGRMLSTELDAGSFAHPDTMHHAKNIVQVVVEDIQTALMRDARRNDET